MFHFFYGCWIVGVPVFCQHSFYALPICCLGPSRDQHEGENRRIRGPADVQQVPFGDVAQPRWCLQVRELPARHDRGGQHLRGQPRKAAGEDG
jgi:hypothetical protein